MCILVEQIYDKPFHKNADCRVAKWQSHFRWLLWLIAGVHTVGQMFTRFCVFAKRGAARCFFLKWNDSEIFAKITQRGGWQESDVQNSPLAKTFFELYIYIFLTYLALFMLILNDFIWTPPQKKTKVSKPLLAQHHLPRSPSFYFLLPKCHINIRGRARLSAETCSIWQPLISMQGVLSEAPHSPKNYPTPRPSDKFICLAVRRGRKGWLRERDKGGEGWKSLSWEKKKWQTGDKRNINRQGQASQCS